MRLSFPNPSRLFDASKNRVAFWGYDETIEITFFIELDALKKLCPKMNNSENDTLQAFDSERAQIYKAADKKYLSTAKQMFVHVLVASDI